MPSCACMRNKEVMFALKCLDWILLRYVTTVLRERQSIDIGNSTRSWRLKNPFHGNKTKPFALIFCFMTSGERVIIARNSNFPYRFCDGDCWIHLSASCTTTVRTTIDGVSLDLLIFLKFSHDTVVIMAMAFWF